MFDKILNRIQEKSLIERFLLVITILVFLGYLFLGLGIIFWKEFPIDMEFKYRVALGVLLIGYSFLRFSRFYNANKE